MKISPAKTISITGLFVIFIILIIMHNGDKKIFDKIRESYLNWYFRSNPVTATWIGIHTYDAKLPFNRMEDYVQDMNNIKFECVAEMEKEAWPLQKEYLKDIHKFDWNYDELWHLVISGCGDDFID